MVIDAAARAMYVQRNLPTNFFFRIQIVSEIRSPSYLTWVNGQWFGTEYESICEKKKMVTS